MDLDKFAKKYEISLSPKGEAFCQKGLFLMKKSKDPLHDDRHIQRLLKNLDGLFSEERGLRGKVDLEVLLIAIFWHDAWKAGRFPLTFVWVFWNEIWEGWASFFLIRKKMREEGFPSAKIKEVAYALRKHSFFQVLEPKTLEAKILWDVDHLDLWSLERITPLKKVFLQPKNINPKLLRLAKFFFEKVLLRIKEEDLHFAWSKKEFRERKAIFLKEVEKLEKEYGKYL